MARTRGGLAVCAVAATVFVAQAPAQEAFPNGACAAIEAGTPPVCTKLHETGTALRLPADGEATYGAVSRDTKFVTASGRHLEMTDEVRQQIETTYATTVYRASVAGERVTAVEPVLRVRSEAIMERLFAGRVLVGKISARTSKRGAEFPTFAGRPTLPVVIEISARARDAGIRGTIVNAKRAVRVGKRCAPALDRHRRNPLVKSFTRRIEVIRHPAMHMPFMDALVLAWTRDSSGMGSELYPSLATLIGHDPLGKRWDVVQHGAPSAGPELSLSFAPRGARPRSC